MANTLSLATNQNLPAAYVPGVQAGGNLIDRNAVLVYEREKRIRYSVTLSGNYAQHVRGQNVGEVLNLAGSPTGTNYQPDQYWGLTGPIRLYMINPGTTGYAMSICPGADSFHWLLIIYSGIAAELAAGAYPAGLTTDLDIVVEATGLSFQ